MIVVLADVHQSFSINIGTCHVLFITAIIVVLIVCINQEKKYKTHLIFQWWRQSNITMLKTNIQPIWAKKTLYATTLQ